MRNFLSKENAALAAFLVVAAATWFAWGEVITVAQEVDSGGSIRALIGWLLLLLVPPAVTLWLLRYLHGGLFSLLVIIAVAVAIRVPFLDCDPLLSDDIYRYLWDGQVQAEGINPYLFAPEDVDLEGLPPDLEKLRSKVNHPEVITVYPPLLEECFHGAARFFPGMRGWRLLILAAEGLLALMLIRLLERRDLDPRRIVLYLWHPLAVVENSWSGHAEGIAVLLFLWALTLLDEEKPLRGALAVGAAIAAKLLPVGLLPLLWRRGGIPCLTLTAAVIFWCAFPYRDAGVIEATSGLREYAGSWYFNDFLYRPLAFLLGIDPLNRHDSATLIYRVGLLVAWAGVCLFTWKKEPLIAGLTITTAFILLTPTLHPWYLLWVLPLTVVVRAPALWLLSGTVLISYEVIDRWRAGGEWAEHPLMRALVFGVPLLWLATGAIRSHLLRRKLASAPGTG